MYVIRVRRSEDPWKYFVGIENQLLVISSISSKAMVFHSTSHALKMFGFIRHYFTLDFNIAIYPLSDVEQIDFACYINQNYIEV